MNPSMLKRPTKFDLPEPLAPIRTVTSRSLMSIERKERKPLTCRRVSFSMIGNLVGRGVVRSGRRKLLYLIGLPDHARVIIVTSQGG